MVKLVEKSSEQEKAQRSLLVLPALQAARSANGNFILTKKFLDGVVEYCRYWHGPVVVGMAAADRPSDNLDNVEVRANSLPFKLCWLNDEDDERTLISNAAVVLASLVDRNVHLAKLSRSLIVPLVYLTEYSVETRRQIVRAETANPVLRWRRERWTTQLEDAYKNAIRAAAGVQCNGTPTFEQYQLLNENAMLFFDTRMRASEIVAPQVLQDRVKRMLQGGPLHLAFTGRLIAMKGADHLPAVAIELKKLGVPFTFDICGDGALRDEIERHIEKNQLRNQVRMRGVLEFQTELVPFMSREVDLFVCCHRQGDPSCTYLETMASGVPIVGYENEAFRGIVEQSSVGWMTPMDDPKALAEKIANLYTSRSAIAQAAFEAVAFASRHTFEKTMKARIEHLRRCSSLIKRVEAAA